MEHFSTDNNLINKTRVENIDNSTKIGFSIFPPCFIGIKKEHMGNRFTRTLRYILELVSI